MSGSIYGEAFRVSTFGESHGPALGCVIDGCPAGLEIDMDLLHSFLARRRPGQSNVVTGRNESDDIEIVSGVFCGKTTGSPITVIVRNQDANSSNYDEIKDKYRPGHADYTYDCKYGFRDYRGGGRSSGRETVARVIAGAIATMILAKLGIEIHAYTRAISDIEIDHVDYGEIDNPVYMPDSKAAKLAYDRILEAKAELDSVGGIIECTIDNLPAGIGEPVFDKYDANLAKAVMSIGGIRGFEIGDGFEVAKHRGSENNDSFVNQNGKIEKSTNHSGGVLGGITDGSQVLFRAAVKPTPSIGKKQNTVTSAGDECEIEITGRHDPCIVPRAVVVVESMAAIATVDMLFSNMSARMDNIIDFIR